MNAFMKTTGRTKLLSQLTLSVAAGALISGYGRATYAGDCIAQGGGTYTCTGAAQQGVDQQQNFEAAVDLQITTEEGFGLDTSATGLSQGFNIDNATSVEIDGTASGEIISDGNAIDLFRVDGDVTIDITGLEITSVDIDGIEASGFSGDGNVLITTGNINADADAIDLDHEVFGNVDINTTAGDVNSARADGIDVVKSGGGTVNIAAANIAARTEGVDVTTQGALDLTIDTSAGAVTTETGQGFLLDTYASGDITVNTGNIISEEQSILLNSGRNGDVFIDTTAGVLESRSSYGINVESDTDLSVEVRTGEVNAAYEGVEVIADDTDFVTIDTSGGAVTAGEDGVRLEADNPINLLIRTGDVDAEDSGISVNSNDGFDVRIDTLAGTVAGEDGAGIAAVLENQNNTYLYTGAVTGSETGIFLDIENADDLDLDATGGAVTGDTAEGVNVRLDYTGYADIKTSGVTGGTKGINVYADDAGDIFVSSFSGAVTGETEEGIAVESLSGQSVNVSTGDVTGGTTGIAVTTFEGEDIVINSRTGTVIGQTDVGIEVDQYSGFDVDIQTDDVVGATYGVLVTSDDGTGIDIDTTGGAVEGTANTGISAYGFNGVGNVDILTSNVTGGETGVYAAGDEVNTFDIDTTGGNVTAGTGIGVEVDANFADTIDVRTANVTGGDTGVQVNAELLGGEIDDITDVGIDTSAGAVNGGQFGILAYNDSTGATEIVAGDVTGGDTGIAIETEGNASLEVRGAVTGGTGIDVTDVEDLLDQGSQLIISGSVTGTDGTAIALGDGADSVDILGGAPGALALRSAAPSGPGIFGDTLFGAGNDSLSFIGTGADDPIFSGSFGGLFDGGADEDRAILSTFIDNVFGATLIDDVLKLDFESDAGDLAFLNFTNFELFSFADDAERFFGAADLVDLIGDGGGNVGVVPLPPGALLLASGLFGFGWMRRRRIPRN